MFGFLRRKTAFPNPAIDVPKDPQELAQKLRSTADQLDYEKRIEDAVKRLGGKIERGATPMTEAFRQIAEALEKGAELHEKYSNPSK